MASTKTKLQIGQRQADAGDYQAALETFQGILAREPGNLPARVSQAHVLSYLVRYQDAERAFVELVISEPARIEYRIALAQLYTHLGRRGEALATFRGAIEIDPANESAWSGISNLASAGSAPAADAAPLDERAKTYRERRRLILVDRLHPLLAAGERLVVTDGGARDALADWRWQGVPAERLKVYAFEPDEAECERLTRQARAAGRDAEYFPIGVWSSDATLSFECNNIGGGSSFLKQNRRVTDRWKFENPGQAVPAPEIFFPVKEIPIAVTSLESLVQRNAIPAVDFAKLNVQGGELEILGGAGALLNGMLGLLVEVAFVESYDRRPFFSDIDQYLRDRGFVFFDLLAHHYVGRASASIVAQHLQTTKASLGQLISSWGQLIEGHALYLRDPIAGDGTDPTKQVIKLICIAEIFGQVEFAFELLTWLAGRCRDRSEHTLAERFSAIRAEAEIDYRRIM